ncbi:MAG TPA: efflux RND transporter periplasmic adaptor subunit, partial [Gemmatimonadaceae bacterium]
NYINPEVDPSLGTLYVRAIFENTDRAIMPGNFVRVRVPVQREPDALLVADTAIGSDQGGRYVLVVNSQNVVEQKHVDTGQLEGDLRVIEKGLAASDHVVVDGLQRAIPGSKVEPQVQTASAAN